MKKILALLLFISYAGAQEAVLHGKASITCVQFKNSFGIAGTGKSGTPPWRYFNDTVFIDSTGAGAYKKGNLYDTTKGVFVSGALSFFEVGGNRKDGHDSGQIGQKLQCYSGLGRDWVTLKNMLCDTLNTKCDTTTTIPIDSGAYLTEVYRPAGCDSVRLIQFTTGLAGAANGDSIKQTVNGVCAY